MVEIRRILCPVDFSDYLNEGNMLRKCLLACGVLSSLVYTLQQTPSARCDGRVTTTSRKPSVSCRLSVRRRGRSSCRCFSPIASL